MQTLTYLIAEMRELGIKSLALELSDDSGSPAIAYSDDRATLAPDASPAAPETEPEPKDPKLCVALGCGAEKRGLFGSIASDYCRTHALQKAGVKT